MTQPNFKTRPLRDPRHLANIRQCCCVVCGYPTSAAHHLLRAPGKAMGRRSGDNWLVPLCGHLEGHHQGPESVHASGNERVWFEAFGLDGNAIAEALWAARGDLEAMQRIARQTAQRVRAA